MLGNCVHSVASILKVLIAILITILTIHLTIVLTVQGVSGSIKRGASRGEWKGPGVLPPGISFAVTTSIIAVILPATGR